MTSIIFLWSLNSTIYNTRPIYVFVGIILFRTRHNSIQTYRLFQDIAEVTHVTKMEELYGEMFSESDSPRAVIFKREFKNATSLESILKLMRMNNITANNTSRNVCDDPKCLYEELGYHLPGVRGDLVESFKESYGIIDTKIVTGKIAYRKIKDSGLCCF